VLLFTTVLLLSIFICRSVLWYNRVMRGRYLYCTKIFAPPFFHAQKYLTPLVFHQPPSPVIGANLSEPHSLVAHRGQAQCIMVRSLYVRTRNFSYSDLNPTGFSPRTGYFENFQSLYITVIYSKFYGPFASHRLTIFHAMKYILHAK
jgi:hypothetical protein